MLGIQEATEALRVELHKKVVDSHVQDAFDNLASCLVLLNTSSPSVKMIRKLCAVLRQPFIPLYNACLRPALQLSSSVLSTVLGRLCDAHNAEDESLRAAWDTTAEVILSGVLDFLDQNVGVSVVSHDEVWETLCRIICEFFLDSGVSPFSIPLCLSAYNTLTETSVAQITIRNALRQRNILGGERLGAAISATRDYLLLEALLILFARLLPPTVNTSQGKFRRMKFVKEVLGSAKLFKCSAELLDIVQKTSDIHWDNVSAQIIDVLARSDITYPQPFCIDEICVCGRVFPQPLATDRLIMDRQAFLANIVVENDDLCESLQVPYSHIRTITLDNSDKNVPKGKVSITVHLTSPPVVADIAMKSPDANHLHAKFLLQDDAVGRFMEALRRRGVGKLSFLNPLTRVERKHKSVSIGSGFKFSNDSSPIPPIASFEGKVQRVYQVYKADTEDLITSQAIPPFHVEDASSSPTTNRKSPFANEKLAPKVLQPAVTEDVPAVLENTRLIQPTNVLPRTFQNFTGTTHLFDDDDELSEISEFEADVNVAGVRLGAATKVSAPSNHGLKPTIHRMDRMQMGVGSSATSEGIERSSDSVSKRIGVAQRSPEPGKPQMVSDSSMFGASSFTHIDISPKLLSDAETLFTTVDTGVIDCLSGVASQNLITAELKNSGVDECGPSDTILTTDLEEKLPIELSFANEKLGQHTRYFTPASGAIPEVPSRMVDTKDTSVPPTIAGSRRKRGPIKDSSKRTIEVDEEYTHPRKKSRGDKLVVEDKIKSDVTSPEMKRYPKTAKRSSPEFGTRRSSRIKRRQVAATSGTRSKGVRSKTQKEKQAVAQSVSASERKKLGIVPSQLDTSVEIGHRTQSILASQPIPPVVGESPLLKTNSQTSWVELSKAEDITPDSETNVPRRLLEASSSDPQSTSANHCLLGNDVLACTSDQPTAPPGKELVRVIGFVQKTASNVMRLDQEQNYIGNEEVIDDLLITSDLLTMDEVNRVSEDLVEPFRPTMKSTPQKELVTIDLTRDDSPARADSGLQRMLGDAVRSEAVIKMKHKALDLCGGIAVEVPDPTSSPRNRRRSVTFASPIEHVLDKKLQSKTQVSSSSAAQIRQPPSPAESSTLSPLRIPTRFVSVRRKSPPSRINPRASSQSSRILPASVHDQTVDEVGIQNIVDVLDEIQAVLVIIRGISDRFRNVKKDVQHSRDELTQQVLKELQGMVVENAQYFNELLRLEENYYKNCKAIVRCWEELIDCNDGIAVHFQNALKEHDQKISAKTFPSSLVPMQPVFTRRHANA